VVVDAIFGIHRTIEIKWRRPSNSTGKKENVDLKGLNKPSLS